MLKIYTTKDNVIVIKDEKPVVDPKQEIERFIEENGNSSMMQEILRKCTLCAESMPA